MYTSRTTSSGLSSLIFLSAAAPLLTATTSYPASLRIFLPMFWAVMLSSANKIFKATEIPFSSYHATKTRIRLVKEKYCFQRLKSMERPPENRSGIRLIHVSKVVVRWSRESCQLSVVSYQLPVVSLHSDRAGICGLL